MYQKGYLSRKTHFAVSATRGSIILKSNRVLAPVKESFQRFPQSLFALGLSRFVRSHSVCFRPSSAYKMAETVIRALTF